MFCGNCGAENLDEAKFCKECGHPLITVEKKSTSIDLAQGVEKVKNLQKKHIISGLIALAIFVVVICISNIARKTINLNDYLIIETEGYDGYGRAKAVIDWDAIEDKYGDKLSYTSKAKNEGGFAAYLVKPTELAQNYVTITLDNTSDLSNGDEINYTWNIDDKFSEYINCKIKYKDDDFKVSDLKEVGTFDAFADFEVIFSGIAPNGRADYDYSGAELNYYVFQIDKDRGLSNGDKVKVSIDESYIEKCAEQYGEVPAEKEKEYTVAGLESYVSKISEIDEAALESMNKQASDAYNAMVAKKWDENEETLESFTYLGNYLLTAKSSDTWGDMNRLYLVYKVQIRNVYESKGNSYDKINDIYYYLRYDDLMVGSDGKVSVDVTNYRTPDERVIIDSGVSDRWGYNKKWDHNGYASIEDLYKSVVTSNLDVFNYEDNMGTNTAPMVVEEEEPEGVVDISAYLTETSKCYGGNLEEQLAEKLGVKFEDGENLDGFYEGHIDGDKIVIADSFNASGYFIYYNEQIPNFYIFGTCPGMKEDEAKQALESNGLSDGNGIYTIDGCDDYVSLEVKNGTVDSVTFVKCYLNGWNSY